MVHWKVKTTYFPQAQMESLVSKRRFGQLQPSCSIVFRGSSSTDIFHGRGCGRLGRQWLLVVQSGGAGSHLDV
jgi:hypothetical protein